MYLPTGVVQQEQLAAAIADVEKMLGPDVVRIRYTVGENWAGDPAIHFRVLLSDQASDLKHLREVTSRINAIIQERIDRLNSWGLVPYIRFRSESEQAVLQEPTWA